MARAPEGCSMVGGPKPLVFDLLSRIAHCPSLEKKKITLKASNLPQDEISPKGLVLQSVEDYDVRLVCKLQGH